MSNRNRAVFINVFVMQLINIQLTEVLVFNNTFYNSLGMHFKLKVSSSKFNGNYSDNEWNSINGHQTSVKIDNSNFTDNQNANLSLLAFAIWPNIRSKVTFYKVQFNNYLGGKSVIVILAFKRYIEINMHMMNFTHNKYSASALYISPIDGNNCTFLLKSCEFVNNQSPGKGIVLYFLPDNSIDAYVQIQDTNFNQNEGGRSIVDIATTQTDVTYLLRVQCSDNQINISVYTNN